VHVEKEKGAILTWLAVTTGNQRLSMDVPIEVNQNSYSYRHELIGIYEGLPEILENCKHIRGLLFIVTMKPELAEENQYTAPSGDDSIRYG
jgi:hypothetical protein